MRVLWVTGVGFGDRDDPAIRAWRDRVAGLDGLDAAVIAGGLLADDLVSPAVIDAARAWCAALGVPVLLVAGGRDPDGPDHALRAIATPDGPLVLDGVPWVGVGVQAADPYRPVLDLPEGAQDGVVVAWAGPVTPDGTGPDKVVDAARLRRQGARAVLLTGCATLPHDADDGVFALEDGAVVIDGHTAEVVQRLPRPPLPSAVDPSLEGGLPLPTEGVLGAAAEALAGDPPALSALRAAIEAGDR